MTAYRYFVEIENLSDQISDCKNGNPSKYLKLEFFMLSFSSLQWLNEVQ